MNLNISKQDNHDIGLITNRIWVLAIAEINDSHTRQLIHMHLIQEFGHAWEVICDESNNSVDIIDGKSIVVDVKNIDTGKQYSLKFGPFTI